MTSERNSGRERDTVDRLLAAARSCVLEFGWKKTTLTDVANRAGVSRMTVYRTYSDMESLLADLMTREWGSVVADVMARNQVHGDWPTRIASGVAGVVTALRTNALLERTIAVDPEWLLPYLLERRGRSQDAVLGLLTERVSLAQAEGAVRAGSPGLLAKSIVLTAHGFVLSALTMTDDTALTELDQELAEMIRRFLAP